MSETNGRRRCCDARDGRRAEERRRRGSGGRNGPLSLTAAVFIIILGDKGKLRSDRPESFHLLRNILNTSGILTENVVCFDHLFHTRLLPKVYIWCVMKSRIVCFMKITFIPKGFTLSIKILILRIISANK